MQLSPSVPLLLNEDKWSSLDIELNCFGILDTLHNRDNLLVSIYRFCKTLSGSFGQ